MEILQKRKFQLHPVEAKIPLNKNNKQQEIILKTFQKKKKL